MCLNLLWCLNLCDSPVLVGKLAQVCSIIVACVAHVHSASSTVSSSHDLPPCVQTAIASLRSVHNMVGRNANVLRDG